MKKPYEYFCVYSPAGDIILASVSYGDTLSKYEIVGIQCKEWATLESEGYRLGKCHVTPVDLSKRQRRKKV